MEKKVKVNIIIIVLLLITIGLAGYICYDKLLNKKDNLNDVSNCETAVNIDENNKDEVSNSEKKNETNIKEDEVITNNYVNKVYGNANIYKTIILFSTGNCVYTSYYNYASKCNYIIEGDKIFITHTHIGTSRDNNLENEVYLVYNDENNQEYIISENDNDRNNALKYLKTEE